jgi:hypothetical protein
LLEAHDIPGELGVDKQSFLSSGRMSPHDGMDRSIFLSVTPEPRAGHETYETGARRKMLPRFLAAVACS